jgi:hypothetical protein
LEASKQANLACAASSLLVMKVVLFIYEIASTNSSLCYKLFSAKLTFASDSDVAAHVNGLLRSMQVSNEQEWTVVDIISPQDSTKKK